MSPAVQARPIDSSVHVASTEPWLSSALAVAQRTTGADGCALAWIDRTQAVRTAQVGLGDQLVPRAIAALHEPTSWPGDGTILGLRDHAGRVLGVLAVDCRPDGDEPLAAVADHIGLLLRSAQRDAERTAAYEALIEVSSQIHEEELSTDAILALIVRQARHLMGVDVTWLALVDEGHERVVVKVASGATTEGFVHMWVQVGKGVGGLAVRDRRPVAVRDHRSYDHPTTDLVIQTLEAEGVVSLLAVPMMFEGRPIGALYGGSRTPTDFTDTAVSVFTALAGQAAVSIANSRLYRDLSAKTSILERVFALNESLTDAALAGGGVDGIAGRLAGIVGRDIVLERAASSQRARRYSSRDEGQPPEELAPDAPAVLAEFDAEMPIVAGDAPLGTIRVSGRPPLTDLELNSLRQGATVLALEMVKERAALEAEWRLRGELLEEILQADGAWSDGLVLRSQRFGVDLDEPRCLAVIEPVTPHDAHDLQFIVRATFSRDLGDGTALLASRGERVLVAFARASDTAAAALRHLLDKAERGGIHAIAGVSTPRRNLSMALKEASAALALARKAGAGGIVAHDQLGPLRFLLDAPDTGQMVEMVQGLLGPVRGHDAKRAGQILATLRAYLELGGNRAAVAERCHIHISTVKYRMRKAADLLDMTLSDPRTRFELTLAFHVLDVLSILGIDPWADAPVGPPRP